MSTSAVLTVSLYVELAGARSAWFFMLWRNAGSSCRVSSVVRIGIMGGRETLAAADSSVVAKITRGDGLTTGIIVEETLVGCEGVIV